LSIAEAYRLLGERAKKHSVRLARLTGHMKSGSQVAGPPKKLAPVAAPGFTRQSREDHGPDDQGDPGASGRLRGKPAWLPLAR